MTDTRKVFVVGRNGAAPGQPIAARCPTCDHLVEGKMYQGELQSLPAGTLSILHRECDHDALIDAMQAAAQDLWGLIDAAGRPPHEDANPYREYSDADLALHVDWDSRAEQEFVRRVNEREA